jgi:hypothetical protein
MPVLRAGDRHWPLTSCAHRLRKPHHADEPLTPAVTRRPRRHGILPLPRRRPWIRRQKRRTLELHRVRTRRPHRLFKATAPAGPERLPSDCPPTLTARVGWFANAVKRTRISPSTRLLAAIQDHPVKGWLVASNYPSSADPPCDVPPECGKDASLRLLQPTYATSTPTDDSIPEFAGIQALRPFGRLKSFGGGLAADRLWTTRVELRLTAILQLRQRSRPSMREPGAVGPRGRARRWRRPVLAGAAIGSPSVRRRPAAVFSTASRARDTTSDALCRARRASGLSPMPAGSQVRCRRRLVKDTDLIEPERLPSDECSLSRARHRSHDFAAASRLPALVRCSRTAGLPLVPGS